MDIAFQLSAQGPWQADCLLLPAFEDAPAQLPAPLTQAAPWLAASPAFADHSGRAKSLTMCHGDAHAPISRVLAVGLGKREAFSPETLRNALASAVRLCRERRLSRLALAAESLDLLSGPRERAALLEEAVSAALLAAYSCTLYRSDASLTEAERFRLQSFALLYENDRPQADAEAMDRGRAAASGVQLARDLVNGPASVITPARMAETARDLAGRHGFSCRVLGPGELRILGMGAFLAVAAGSRQEPRLIVLEYAPKGMEGADPLVLVGKGVTFDSGGISLKPAADMHRMKGDMAGAAAVLGVFEAIGKAPGQCPGRVVGIMPCAENMPDGNATRPGDIVATMAGKTVEITNTDAEGRLILCDALSYAQKEWKPKFLVDIATLTGACVVALGKGAAGLFCDDEALRGTLLACGEKAGEALWPMPLWKSFAEQLKSPVADMANAGSREGGAIYAALFLKQFVADKQVWAHLDMAGAGYATKTSALCPEGGTGFGVRTLYGLVQKTDIIK